MRSIPEDKIFKISSQDLTIGFPIGMGSNGAVHQSIYQGEVVAVKYFYSQADFTAESEALNACQGPHVVKLRGTIPADEKSICHKEKPMPGIVMEYCSGGSFSDILFEKLKGQHIDLKNKIPWMLQIALGLADIHKKGYIHRDIKLDNILFTENGEIRISDFSMSFLRENAEQKATEKGYYEKTGTLSFLDPQSLEFPYSPAMDVYSLGVVLWSIVVQKKPFYKINAIDNINEGRKQLLIKKQLIFQKPEDNFPFSDDDKVSDSLRKLIRSCWDSDHAKRPTAEQVGDQLSQILKQLMKQPTDLFCAVVRSQDARFIHDNPICFFTPPPKKQSTTDLMVRSWDEVTPLF